MPQIPDMGKYDHFLNEAINPGKSYRSYRKASKKKQAAAKAIRLAELQRAKAKRDKTKKDSGERYIPWPEYLL